MSARPRLLLPCLVGVLLLASSATGQLPAPRVVDFNPQGVVKPVRQVTARFSDPMVPLGDPRPPTELFDIACPEAGAPRWADSRNWVYDFLRDLPAGVRCTFRLRAGVASLDGRAVGGPSEFSFSTGGPAVKASMPLRGVTTIEEDQAFLLILDAAATERSVLDHVSFVVEGLAARVGARIVSGEAADAIVRTRPRWLGAGPAIVLQARQQFPSGARVRLVWGQGVRTASGVATDQDQVLEFGVREAFRVDFHCEREHRTAPCVPAASMRVLFTAPVAWEQARHIALAGPGGQRWSASVRDPSRQFAQSVVFRPPFPESASFTVEIPNDLRDESGRAPINAASFPLAVKTATFPPLAKFSARFGIVERADPVLPVTLRRLEPEVVAALLRVDHEPRAGVRGWLDAMQASVLRIPPEHSAAMLPWLRKVAEARRHTSVLGGAAPAVRVTLPKPGGADAFEVVGIPLRKPGLYVVELASRRLGASLLDKPGPMYVPAAALVTNLSVHFKWGPENAVAWVTTLDRARPVRGARVTVVDCTNQALWRGRTDGDGIARISGLPSSDAIARCGDLRPGDDWPQSRALAKLNEGLLVIAQTPDDLGLVHSTWQSGIEPWRFGLRSWFIPEPVFTHTIFDRTLLRAGDTVHMKHMLRAQTLDGFGQVAEAERPRGVSIRHSGSDEKWNLPISWDRTGVAETAWQVPRNAKLGAYEVVLTGGRRRGGHAGGEVERVSGQFQVEEFRLPFMKALVRPPAAPQVDVAEVPLDLGMTYLAGGVVKRLPIVVRAQVSPHALPMFEGFENFLFSNGAVKEGITRRGAPGDELDEGDEEESPPPAPARAKPVIHQRDELTLDDTGTARVTIRRLPRNSVPQDLLAEVEWKDPAGETQTVSTRVLLWPASRLVGIATEGWAFDQRVQSQVAVVDLRGRPVASAPVRVDAFERKLYSVRKRLVGGFYAYDHVQEVRRIGELCGGTTNAGGVFVCDATAPATGHLILQARTTDEAGRTTVASRDVWIVDRDGAWWFDVTDSDRIDVIPERRRYEPGERARFQVRMPFREATALVTTEREGTIDAKVARLAGSDPTIEVPVGPGHAPNVFVSVLAVRGRVGDVQATATVDLGRPAFKLGIAEIHVGWRAHELEVTVSPGRAVYRVRERAAAKVTVRTLDGALPPPGTEIALAAVDEALLELAPNTSWNLLESMMRRRGDAVATATAHMQVVGKRHFGLKALPQGGGGGRQTTRELFDTLLAWKGRVTLDERGEASVEIPLNDSLTSFRIVAVATGAAGLFGTGSATIRSTQDLMVLPGIPPLVREGDRFTGEVTLRNATDHPMDVMVAARADGLQRALEPHALSLAPGEARLVGWDVAVPAGVDSLGWQIEAAARGGPGDRVSVKQEVVPAIPVRVFQATLAQSEGIGRPLRQTVERPRDAVTGRGGLGVTLAASLIDGATPLREWMTAYPYRCLEQEVSRAIALRDEGLWRAVVASLPAHLDADGLLKYFPPVQHGSDALTSYVLAIAHEAGWAIPGETRSKLEGGLRAFLEGRIIRYSGVAAADLPMRKVAALEALSRYGAVDPGLAGTITIEPNLWPTSAVLDWWSVLRRVGRIADRPARLVEAERIVRARLNFQGTVMSFSTERRDGLWWLMVSEDVNAVRLVLNLLDAGIWTDDLPRVMRGALARQRHGAWDLTVANAWGVLALEKFSRAFERTPLGGATSVELGGATKRVDWAPASRRATVEFPWPRGPEELRVDHEGAGRPWITVQSRAAIPLTAPLSTGYAITRTVTPIERRVPDRWSRGDIARVRLEVDAQSDMTWVVVTDPIPAGASHIGRGLARESSIVQGGETMRGQAWPAFAERSFQAFRGYYEWVPKGRFVVEYTIRLNQPGRFVLPPTRVEALYSPEMLGELPNAPLDVHP